MVGPDAVAAMAFRESAANLAYPLGDNIEFGNNDNGRNVTAPK